MCEAFVSFFFNHPAPTEIYTLSLHDALPISIVLALLGLLLGWIGATLPGDIYLGLEATAYYAAIIGLPVPAAGRSEEHTSELQSHSDIVCRLLLEKKNIQYEALTRCSRKIRF